MLLLVVKFVIFTLVPSLLLIWSILPELCTYISSSSFLVRETPAQFLCILDNLPGKSNDLLFTGKNLVFSLTRDNSEFSPAIAVLRTVQEEKPLTPDPLEVNELPLAMYHWPQSMLPSLPPDC
ncbi:hypothetical protein DSO57_1039572 [Entomophthora muscae]|uniref:Uncharacterized protein n=1 Tax=Entomophthora muscae TaxID=34485 RepID=A0ACC2S0I8_9FUNG|nr:hypothetical protein DSO57_1039572 [Entomophthora muscae]